MDFQEQAGRQGQELTLSLRAAKPADLKALTSLAIRSKAHWGYDQDFMNACEAELVVPPSALEDEIIRLAEENGVLAGFYRLIIDDDIAELEAMFVEPDRIGKGVGAVLWRDMLDRAHDAGARKLVCQSDPFAEGFYKAMGMVRTGERASDSVRGRMLPVLEMGMG
ncbi:MAG: GNAT family N-acetyltransferase [Pseudomonadota bacterium]